MRRSGSGNGTTRFGFKALAAVVAALTISFTSGVVAAHAAAGDESHATGTYLSGSLLAGLTPLQLAQLGSAAADNDGTQATQTEQNALNATVLNALTVDINDGLQIPLNVADVGVLSSFAQAQNEGSSIGASGLVASDGGIGVGEVAPGDVPSNMTLDLSDTLGVGFASEIANLQLELGATSARAESVAGGAPVGTYEIDGGRLLFTSATIDAVSDVLTTLGNGLTSDINALTGPGGTLAGAVVEAAEIIPILGLLGVTSAEATVTVDVNGAITPLLTTVTDGAVTVNLLTGEIFVDLEVLNAGSLNGKLPNTNILTNTQLIAITTSVSNILSDLATDVETAVTDALNAAVVHVDVSLDVAGIPLVQVEVDGTVAEVIADTSTIQISALGIVDIGLLTEAVLNPLLELALADVVDTTTGDLGDFIDDLQTDVVDPVIDDLNPLLLLLDDVVLLTVNNQNPSPPVAGALFTETALRLQLLPQGPITALLELNVAEATVGPNAVGAVPVITDIDPDNGPESGGTVVTITGTGFVGATGVTFDGLPGTTFTVDSDTQITVTSPAHVPETVDVVILHPAGPSLPGDFTYTPLISVTDIDPNFGPIAGGTVVDIFGTCFTGATGVTFDGVAGTSFSVIDDTHIQVTSPPHAVGAVDVVVLGSLLCGGDETVPDGFTYVAAGAPTITGMVPDNGPESGGTDVVITGTGFTGATGVTFDGLPATGFLVVNDTTINATSPAHAPGLVGVVVLHPSGNSGPFDFTYTPLISVTSIDPDFGPEAGGTIVTITGTCFTGATGVLFGGIAGTAFLVNSDTSITVTTPPGTGLVDVTIQGSVVCGGNEVVPDAFQYIAADAPVILDLDPDSGPFTGGTAVTVTGSGFLGATGVTFDGIPATSVVVVNDTTITLITPPNAVGPANVVVQHPNGPSAPLVFTYLPATTVTDVDPDNGPEAGGTAVTITGTCFIGATGVLFGSTPATSFIVVNDTTITAVSPKGVGTVDVTVLGTLACGIGSQDDAFRYIAAGMPVTGAVVLPTVLGALGLIIAGLALAIMRRRSQGIV